MPLYSGHISGGYVLRGAYCLACCHPTNRVHRRKPEISPCLLISCFVSSGELYYLCKHRIGSTPSAFLVNPSASGLLSQINTVYIMLCMNGIYLKGSCHRQERKRPNAFHDEQLRVPYRRRSKCERKERGANAVSPMKQLRQPQNSANEDMLHLTCRLHIVKVILNPRLAPPHPPYTFTETRRPTDAQQRTRGTGPSLQYSWARRATKAELIFVL